MAEPDPLKIDQCLFGYSDGHRLLESSVRLAADLAADLTAASDLAPGARFLRSQGYLTGFPVPKLARYGLMCTWAAPEMPRPGCVWTQLLLIDPKLFEIVEDLAWFTTLIRRPSLSNDRTWYSKAIEVASLPKHSQEVKSRKITARFDLSRIIELLQVLYGHAEGPVEVGRPGELDELILSLWSQQWPRLRRNFRFQTAASLELESPSKRFDLQLKMVRSYSESQALSDRRIAMWLQVAAHDIESDQDHELRTFLWKYGIDVKRQRASFRPLTQVFAAARSNASMDGRRLAAYIAKSFPDRDDAFALKQDLIDGVLLENRQVEALLHLCHEGGEGSLPPPTEVGIANLTKNWPSRAGDMMRLAEWAAAGQGALSEALLSAVAGVVPSTNFWTVTDGFPEMRRRMLANQPDLLDSDSISELDPESLLSLLDVIPEGHAVGAALVRRLPLPVDNRVVRKALERFPAAVFAQVIETANTLGVNAATEWLRATRIAPSYALKTELMECIQRTSIVFELASAFDWSVENFPAADLGPWVAGLANAQDDLHQSDRDRMEAFLFKLAATVGGQQAQTLLERSFRYLHDRMLNSYLSWPAQKILRPILPSVGLLREWDDGLKLRLAVTQAYVRHDLDVSSFSRLLDRKQERRMLKKAAEEIYGSGRFVDAL